MKPQLADWTVVLPGSWNPSIFTPDWIRHNLVELEEDEKIIGEILVGPIAGPIKYLTNDYIIIPSADKLIIGIRRLTEGIETNLGEVAKKTLELLKHTPIVSLGVNYGYIENEPNAELLAVFDLSDTPNLSDNGCDIQTTRITRKIILGENILNLNLSYENANVYFHCNFHKDVENANAAVAAIGENLPNFRQLSENLITNSYNLELENLEENNDE